MLPGLPVSFPGASDSVRTVPASPSEDMPPSVRTTREIRAVMAARCVGRAPTVRVHARVEERSAAAGPGHGRAAVVAGRALGTAVARNRAKRRVRAALDVVGVPDATDLVVHPSPAAIDATWPVLVQDVERALGAALRRCAR